MRKRKSTLTQQYSPTFRKRVLTNYLSLSLPGVYANLENSLYFNIQNQPIDQKQKQSHFSYVFESSTGEKSTDKKRMERVQLNYENFVQNYNRIYQIIDSVDQGMRARMEAHQQSLLSVVRSQIEKMQEQCKNVIQQYNNMIRNKNKDEEIYYLKNELDYFRHQALYYFENNKKIMEQNKDLKELIKNKDSIINDLKQIIKKKTIKILKEKALTEKIAQKMEKLNQFTNMKKNSETQIQKQSPEQNQGEFVLKRMKIGKTRITQKKELQQIENEGLSQSNLKKKINFNSTSPFKQKQKKKNNKNWFLELKFSKKRIKTEMEPTSLRQKCFQQINGVKIINKLSLKSEGKSKSLWKFQSKPIL